LVHGLERLEYRGYDSAGLLVGDEKGEMKLIRAVGKVSSLAHKVAQEI
jgi:glucosamine--fructose-6-phosphate aminotransferase (isomerizing)